MIKRIIAITLSFCILMGISAAASDADNMELVFSKDFSSVEADYDITADGWSVSAAPTYDTSGLKISGNNMNMTYPKTLGAKFEVKIDNYYYEWNRGTLYFNADVTSSKDSIKNGYELVFKGQYSSNLTVYLNEYKNGVSRTLSEEIWTEANPNAMLYDIEMSYDRGEFYLKLINKGNTEKFYELNYDFTEGGTVTDFNKSGALRIIGGNGGVLRTKGVEIKTVKSNLTATYLGAPFNAAAMYNAAEDMTAQIAINKELAEISAINCYIDGAEQSDMAYKDGELKANIKYEDNKFKLTLPDELTTGIHIVKVVFTDDLECQKEYEGKFYVGTYYTALDSFVDSQGVTVSDLAAVAGSTVEAKLSYSGIENIIGIACLYNADGKLEKAFYDVGEAGTINILCDIPIETEGYKLSVYTGESFVNSAPLSFALELE